jgi:hypothetical protein
MRFKMFFFLAAAAAGAVFVENDEVWAATARATGTKRLETRALEQDRLSDDRESILELCLCVLSNERCAQYSYK